MSSELKSGKPRIPNESLRTTILNHESAQSPNPDKDFDDPVLRHLHHQSML